MVTKVKRVVRIHTYVDGQFHHEYATKRVVHTRADGTQYVTFGSERRELVDGIAVFRVRVVPAKLSNDIFRED